MSARARKRERERREAVREVVAALYVTRERIVSAVKKRTKQNACSSQLISETMWDSRDTTAINTAGYNSQLSFYEYPPHKPFINSTYQPLRPSHSLSRTVALPESNRDQLLTALQSLSLKIKTLESEREVS